MEIGRRNISKSINTQPANTQETQQPQEQKAIAPATQAKDTFTVSPPPNDLSRAFGDQKKAELKGIVEADQAVLPQSVDENQQKGQQQEHYGTSSSSTPNPKLPDRFGLGNPTEPDLIDELNRRAGWGFNPARDLKISPDDALSTSTKDPLGKFSSPSCHDDQKVKDENQKLKDTIAGLEAQHAFDVTQQAIRDLDARNKEVERLNEKAMQHAKEAQEKAKNPNPDAPDNSSGGPFNPLINNLGSPMRIRQPYIDPKLEEQFGPSGVLKQRNQAVDPNPDSDPNEGGAKRTILSTSDAVTDPTPDLNASLEKLNNQKG
jgi:hypothetical protein